MKKALAAGKTLPQGSYLVIGDVHGCYDELCVLLDSYLDGRTIIFLGDLVNKGPHSRKVLELARLLRAEVIRGNHEENLSRFHKHELSGRKNPMRQPPYFKACYTKVRKSPLALFPFLGDIPDFIRIGDSFLLLHAGLLPGKEPEQMLASQICRVRHVRQDGSFVTLEASQRDRCIPFWTQYTSEDGPTIVYGHSVFPNVRVDGRTIGIDTGCVYGNKLTGLLLPEMTVVSVPARKTYFK